MGRWIEILTGRGRRFIPFIIGAITLPLAFYAFTCGVDESNAAMNAFSGDEERVFHQFQREFGNDEIILLSMTDPEMPAPDGVERLRELTSEIENFDGVARVVSLTNLKEVVAGRFGAEEQLLLPSSGELDPAGDVVRNAIKRNPWLAGLLISDDFHTAGITVELDLRPGTSEYRTRLIENLRALKNRFQDEGVALRVTGIPLQKYDTGRLVRRDQKLFMPLTIVVLALVLGIATRRVSGVLLPLLVTGVAVIWTLGLYSASGHEINIITSLLPPVVMVLSVATGIHLYLGWEETGSVPATLRELGLPVILTAVTTAVGLGSLMLNETPAVQSFGLFGAIGVMLSLFLNLTLLPCLLLSIAPLGRKREAMSGWLHGWLAGIARLTVSRPGTVLVVAGLVTVVAVPGIWRIHNNTDLLRFLKPDAELFQDTMFIDTHLTGAGTLELLVERQDGHPLSEPDDFLAVGRFGSALREFKSVTNVLSLPELLAHVQQAENDLADPVLPETREELEYVLGLVEESSQLEHWLSKDHRLVRVHLRIHAGGTAGIAVLLKEIQSAASRELGARYQATPTGTSYLVVAGSNRLVKSQVKSFGVALIVILLMIGLAFRSVILLVAATVPNLIPIVWVSGAMGWLGIDLSTATVMVASVVLGIAVDDTIHYLSSYRRLQEPSGKAVVVVTVKTGAKLFMTSVVLALGFWVGAFGSFRPTIFFSLLTGATILIALLCDLLVLPSCLVVLDREGK